MPGQCGDRGAARDGQSLGRDRVQYRVLDCGAVVNLGLSHVENAGVVPGPPGDCCGEVPGQRLPGHDVGVVGADEEDVDVAVGTHLPPGGGAEHRAVHGLDRPASEGVLDAGEQCCALIGELQDRGSGEVVAVEPVGVRVSDAVHGDDALLTGEGEGGALPIDALLGAFGGSREFPVL